MTPETSEWSKWTRPSTQNSSLKICTSSKEKFNLPSQGKGHRINSFLYKNRKVYRSLTIFNNIYFLFCEVSLPSNVPFDLDSNRTGKETDKLNVELTRKT